MDQAWSGSVTLTAAQLAAARGTLPNTLEDASGEAWLEIRRQLFGDLQAGPVVVAILAPGQKT
jgi:hypothetical protein